MKKIYYTLSLGCILPMASLQLLGQNVGIGTNSPANKLHVVGNLLVNQPLVSTNAIPTAAQTKTLINGISNFADTDSIGRVYDQGGPTGNYANNCNGAVYTTYFNGTDIGVEVIIEDIDLGTGDSLLIKYYDSYTSPVLLSMTNSNASIGRYTFNTNSICIIFKSNADGNNGRGFSLLQKKLFRDATPIPAVGKSIVGNAFAFDSKKGALRSGMLQYADTMPQYSTAMGASLANGVSATAMGYQCSAISEGSVAMGYQSTAKGLYAVALGNSAADGYAATALGKSSASNTYATSLGAANANGYGSTAMGGSVAVGAYATAMGQSNTSNSYATSLGVATANGYISTAMGQSTTNNTLATAMGRSTANGDTSTAMGNSIAGGKCATAIGKSTANGDYAVAAGQNVIANGTNSVAIGRNVSTSTHTGAFFFGDSDPHNKSIRSAGGPNGFNCRFNAGYYFISDDTGPDIGVKVLGGGNSWSAISDVRRKEKFVPVDGEDFLKKIAAMPLTTWNYKGQNPKIWRHYGPMAQDFFAAFGKDKYGTIGCDTLINQQDFLGINLIAIQALERRTQRIEELMQTSASIAKENTVLRKQVTNMERALCAITKQLESFAGIAKNLTSAIAKN
ncbi:MAG: tail fiber domain-containing protein [Chitinophagaceae bacterium]